MIEWNTNSLVYTRCSRADCQFKRQKRSVRASLLSIIAVIGPYLVSKMTFGHGKSLCYISALVLFFALLEPHICAATREATRMGPNSNMCNRAGMVWIAMALAAAPAGAQEPDLIFRKSTVFKWLTPNDKLATYGIDDPVVEGVACHYTVPEKGGLAGALGVAEQVSDVSLSCRQYGPIKIKEKFDQGDVVYRERRSLIFKKMQIVRGCDIKRNVLVYMVYTDKLIEGSPKNSTSTVPIQPWGVGSEAAKCADFVNR
jgi:CreA protein